MNKLQNEIESYLISSSNKIKINSRDVKEGDVFCALEGSNSHGNEYITDALCNGAKYIFTDKKWNKNLNNNILKVKNSFDFLNSVAIKKRNHFKGKVIAITGSIGKTSIKEYLNFFLLTSLQGKISASIKSYNNLLGTLLSLINMNLNSKYSIFEVGTSNFGEIRKLASLILPEQVIITNISPTHLENFKNPRNVAVEKSDLFNPKYNPHIKLLVLSNNNADEIYLQKIAKQNNIQSIITYGDTKKSNYFIKNIKKINNITSKITYVTPKKTINIEAFTILKHEILNLQIPLIIFNYNKLPIKDFISNIKKIPTIYGRGSYHFININYRLVKLINESYNASPASMLNCINYFSEIELKEYQRKILILGEMLELGQKSSLFHKEVILEALHKSIDFIVFCGSKYKRILSKLNLSLKNVFYFENEFKIIEFLNENIQKNDIILAKGSNSSKVNKLVNLLLKNEIKKGK